MDDEAHRPSSCRAGDYTSNDAMDNESGEGVSPPMTLVRGGLVYSKLKEGSLDDSAVILRSWQNIVGFPVTGVFETVFAKASCQTTDAFTTNAHAFQICIGNFNHSSL